MELPLTRVLDNDPSLAERLPISSIRQFTTAVTFDFTGPQEDVAGGQWELVTSENLSSISATAFYFAQKIQRHLNVRYAWADNPVQANLCNGVGLPASTFLIAVT